MTVLHDYWRSSASYRVRIALNLAGIDWRSETVNLLDGAHRAAAHLARNPQGLVPALEIDGTTLTQSLAIIEYLDETRGLGLLPAEPLGRARVRALSHAIAMEIHPVCNLSVARYATGLAGEGYGMGDWMRHFIAPGLAAYEKLMGEGGFSWGPQVSLADLCLVPQLYNARRWEVDLSGLPKILRAEERLAKIPAFAEAHPDLVTQ